MMNKINKNKILSFFLKFIIIWVFFNKLLRNTKNQKKIFKKRFKFQNKFFKKQTINLNTHAIFVHFTITWEYYIWIKIK